MAKIEFKLKTGLAIGKDEKKIFHFEVVLREPKAGDIIEAQEESEKLVYKVHGEKIEPALVISPTSMGINVLRRQIISIGDIKGPLHMDILKKLTAEDFSIIQDKAQELDNASMELVERGRDGADSRDA